MFWEWKGPKKVTSRKSDYSLKTTCWLYRYESININLWLHSNCVQRKWAYTGDMWVTGVEWIQEPGTYLCSPMCNI